MADVTVRPLSAVETRPLRAAILRPDAPLEASVYPGDDAEGTFHAGAFRGGALVGVASVFHEPPPGQRYSGAWRLRGMAVLDSARRQGVGRALLRACLAHIAARGGSVLWCNARSPAVPFYEALGFETEGNEFLTPDGIPHRRMSRALSPLIHTPPAEEPP